jgi:hypothetical protein
MQVANALQYMHGQEPPLFHRDIKPANIRITPKGQAMLVDFGLVKVFDPFLKTTVGARAITPGYAPPEQYGQGKTDARTDIYALGATLYNLLTGYEPMESVVRLSGEHLMSAHLLNPGVPLAVSDLIERAMALEPGSRFQNMADFKAALQASQEIMQLEGQDKNLVTVIVEPGMESEPFIGAPVETMARPPSGPPPSVPAAFPATAVIEAPLPAAGRPPSAGAVPKPAAKKSWLPIGLAGAAILVLCLGGSAILAALLLSDGDGAPTPERKGAVEATLTARIALLTATGSDLTQKTSAVQSQRTSTGLARATQTSAIQTRRVASTGTAVAVAKIHTSTAAARAKATEQASSAILKDLDSQASLVFGPKSGRIAHENEDGFVEQIAAPVGLRNFITEVIFFNPYPPSEGLFTFGLTFRDGGEEVDYRLVFTSEKEWSLENNTGPDSGDKVASGTIEDLDISETGSNKIRLYVYEDQGWLYVNDKFISELDVSAHYSGSISIGIGYYKDDEITGKLTEYKDFTIWSIPTK